MSMGKGAEGLKGCCFPSYGGYFWLQIVMLFSTVDFNPYLILATEADRGDW